jgi:glutamate synthase (NADPH/NADH) small chain
VYRTSSAHEEGGDRVYSVNTVEFVGDDQGRLRALRVVDVESRVVDGRPSFVPVEGSEREIEADLVFLAMGFVGPERPGLLEGLGVELDERGNVARGDDWASSETGVFVCGDAGRGQSLIVWAIAEGRACAASVDRFLTGETDLPAPVRPTDRPLV